MAAVSAVSGRGPQGREAAGRSVPSPRSRARPSPAMPPTAPAAGSALRGELLPPAGSSVAAGKCCVTLFPDALEKEV